MAIILQRLEILFEREGVHDAVVLLAEGQRAVAAEVAVGLGLADLALPCDLSPLFYPVKNKKKCAPVPLFNLTR